MLLIAVASAAVELILFDKGIDDSRVYFDAIELANLCVAYIGSLHILSRKLIGISRGYYADPFRKDNKFENKTWDFMNEYIEKLNKT